MAKGNLTSVDEFLADVKLLIIVTVDEIILQHALRMRMFITSTVRQNGVSNIKSC
jgi:hypothetical protein